MVVDDLMAKLDRSVAVYGVVNLRTGGRQAILAQKLKRPDANGNKWDVYRLCGTTTMSWSTGRSTPEQRDGGRRVPVR